MPSEEFWTGCNGRQDRATEPDADDPLDEGSAGRDGRGERVIAGLDPGDEADERNEPNFSIDFSRGSKRKALSLSQLFGIRKFASTKETEFNRPAFRLESSPE